MKRIGYSILITVLSPLLILYLLHRGRKSPDYRHRWAERFGLSKLKQTDLLVHSVSMGETLAAVPLVRKLMQAKPEIKVTITTSSPTGSNEVIKAFATELANGRVKHCYLPFDLSVCIKRFLTQVAPKTCIIMETELWPNLIHFADKQGIKLILANGRLSQKSANQYKKWSGISRPMLSKLDALAVQTQIEAQRFIELGVDKGKIHVCGSLKFDLTIAPELKNQAQHLRKQWQKTNNPVWVAGSIHPDEFDTVIKAHKKVLAQCSDALLIMVPRHPEQFNAAAAQLENSDLSFVRRSEQTPVMPETQVLLGDTMGELLTFYGAADQAFIGGSLIKNGGHNPLEAAAMGLPVLFGPNHRDFTEITNLLKNSGNLKIVSNTDELATQLLDLFTDKAAWQQASEAGLAVVAANRGALDKQTQQILSVIPE